MTPENVVLQGKSNAVVSIVMILTFTMPLFYKTNLIFYCMRHICRVAKLSDEGVHLEPASIYCQTSSTYTTTFSNTGFIKDKNAASYKACINFSVMLNEE